MPKGTNQKLKLYYLARIMVEKTDDEHRITMPEIQEKLEAYDVTADRKSLYEVRKSDGITSTMLARSSSRLQS